MNPSQIQQNPIITIDNIDEIRGILEDFIKDNQQAKENFEEKIKLDEVYTNNMMRDNQSIDNIINKDQSNYSNNYHTPFPATHHNNSTHITFSHLTSLLFQKLHTIQNTLKFSIHLLTSLQSSLQQSQTLKHSYNLLIKNNQEIIQYNHEIKSKLEQIQSENDQLTNQLSVREAEYYEEIQTIKGKEKQKEINNRVIQNNLILEEIMQDDYFHIDNLNLNNINRNHSSSLHNKTNLTQRKISLQPHQINPNHNSTPYSYQLHQQLLTQKNLKILQLQQQLTSLTAKINHLQQQLHTKNSQLQISKLYYQQKIQIINNQLESSKILSMSYDKNVDISMNDNQGEYDEENLLENRQSPILYKKYKNNSRHNNQNNNNVDSIKIKQQFQNYQQNHQRNQYQNLSHTVQSITSQQQSYQHQHQHQHQHQSQQYKPKHSRKQSMNFNFNFEQEIFQTFELVKRKTLIEDLNIFENVQINNNGRNIKNDINNKNNDINNKNNDKNNKDSIGNNKYNITKSTQNSQIVDNNTKKTIQQYHCTCNSNSINKKYSNLTNTTSKGIQTCLTIAKPNNNPINLTESTQKYQKRSSNNFIKNNIKPPLKQNKSSTTKEQHKKINSQQQHQHNSSILDISITDLFKGIFDYASKKIVTNRIKNKAINKITGNVL